MKSFCEKGVSNGIALFLVGLISLNQGFAQSWFLSVNIPDRNEYCHSLECSEHGCYALINSFDPIKGTAEDCRNILIRFNQYGQVLDSIFIHTPDSNIFYWKMGILGDGSVLLCGELNPYTDSARLILGRYSYDLKLKEYKIFGEDSISYKINSVLQIGEQICLAGGYGISTTILFLDSNLNLQKSIIYKQPDQFAFAGAGSTIVLNDSLLLFNVLCNHVEGTWSAAIHELNLNTLELKATSFNISIVELVPTDSGSIGLLFVDQNTADPVKIDGTLYFRPDVFFKRIDWTAKNLLDNRYYPIWGEAEHTNGLNTFIRVGDSLIQSYTIQPFDPYLRVTESELGIRITDLHGVERKSVRIPWSKPLESRTIRMDPHTGQLLIAGASNYLLPLRQEGRASAFIMAIHPDLNDLPNANGIGRLPLDSKNAVVYPNPSHGWIRIKSDIEVARVLCYDSRGGFLGNAQVIGDSQYELPGHYGPMLLLIQYSGSNYSTHWVLNQE